MNYLPRIKRPRLASSPKFPEGSSFYAKKILACGWAALAMMVPVRGAVLLDERFDEGIPGWTVVQPPAAYYDGPLRWEWDFLGRAFLERSNVYTDSGGGSPSATAPMLINGSWASAPFTYSARLTAGDDDGFGLVFGYRNESNFYRVVFAAQARASFPRQGWSVDCKTDGAVQVLCGSASSFMVVTGRPFDVTLAVDEQNRLTLQVVDDPAGAATVHLLVDQRALPAAADGRVGLFSWGMGGGDPPGCRIENPELSPGGLQGSVGSLAAWEAVVPPRGDRSTALSCLTAGINRPLWVVKSPQPGLWSSLEETSRSGAGWDAPGRVDFTGPSLVAGDVGWSNYVVAARIVPGDYYGYGLLLRYRNPSNFYRVALRSTPSPGAGIRSGLSVQKNVNGAYSEVYTENPGRLTPARNVPLDLVAEVRSNVLNVLAVEDPDGAADVYRWGPIPISGIDRGKAGLFSWYMYKLECDSFHVCAGAPLYVSSPYGAPNPARGLGDHEVGEWIEAVAGEDDSGPGVRRTVIGWTGSGSVPAQGTGSAVSFVLDSFSQLHWRWKTEFRLAVSNDSGGSVIAPAEEWLPAGTAVVVSARPDPGYVFAGWTGDLQSREPDLNVQMDQPFELTANFQEDRDADGEADAWELAYWGGLQSGHDASWDGWPDRTRPAGGIGSAGSQRLLFDGAQVATNGLKVNVLNRSGARFNLESCSDLASNDWQPVASNLTDAFVIASSNAGSRTFLRLAQPPRPAAAPDFVPGSWTLVVLPDTQFYSESYPQLFADQTRWIAANKDRYDIRYVLHVGDLVNGDVPPQWANAVAAFANLDGVVPYAFVPGNHDYSQFYPVRTSRINTFLPPSRFQSWPTFGGVKDAGRIENSYHLFSAGGSDWLILALEFGPRNATVAWANSILDQYPDRRAIVMTHAYLYDDGTRYDWAAKGVRQAWNPHSYSIEWDPDGTNDGEELWQKMIRQHPNVVWTLNGHVSNDGLGRLTSKNDAGLDVVQTCVNYQMLDLGGQGYLRLMEFRPDGKTVQIKTYSPYNGAYLTDPQNQFMVKLK